MEKRKPKGNGEGGVTAANVHVGPIKRERVPRQRGAELRRALCSGLRSVLQFGTPQPMGKAHHLAQILEPVPWGQTLISQLHRYPSGAAPRLDGVMPSKTGSPIALQIYSAHGYPHWTERDEATCFYSWVSCLPGHDARGRWTLLQRFPAGLKRCFSSSPQPRMQQPCLSSYERVSLALYLGTIFTASSP